MWPLTCIALFSLLLRPAYLSKLILVEHIDIRRGLQSSSILERSAEFIFHLFAPLLVRRIVGVSPGVVNSVRKIPFLFNSKYKYIPNPISSLSSIPASGIPIRNYSSLPSVIYALAVGNFKPQKDYRLMVDSIFSLYRSGIDIRLVIAGSGPLLSDAQSYARSLMPAHVITFLGSVPPQNITELYKSSHVYLLTSAWEGFCNSLAEALSFGCRCVAMDCPSGPSEVLKQGILGTLVKERDPTVFAHAILSEILLNRSSTETTNHVIQFTVETVGQQYLDTMKA